MAEKISRDILKNLHDAGSEVLQLAPWTFMQEDENFAVQAASSGETYYVSVTGAAGISRSIVFYRGAKGWAAYERISNGELQSEDALQELDALTMDFEPWKDIDPDSRKRLKRLGAGPGKNLLPAPLAYHPGRAPSPPNAAESETLASLLRASLPVFRRSLRDPEWLLAGPAGAMFQLRPGAGGDGDNPEGEWLATPEIPESEIETHPPDELMLARMKNEPLRPCQAWEVHVGNSSTPVSDDRSAFFPLMAMFVDSSTGFVAGFALAPASEMPLALPKQCLKAMQSHLAKPEAFHVKRADVAAWLEPISEKLGIPLIQMQALPHAEEAQQALRGFLKKGMPG